MTYFYINFVILIKKKMKDFIYILLPFSYKMVAKIDGILGRIGAVRKANSEVYDLTRDADARYALLVNKTKQELSVYDTKSKSVVFNAQCSTGSRIPSNGYSGQTHNGLFEILLIEDTHKETQKKSTNPYGPFRFSYHNQSVFPNAPAGAIHGTNEPEKLGRAVSNGCTRVSNDKIITLRDKYVGISTPVLVFGG